MKSKRILAEIDQKIISYFLCTHRLDSTKVDVDPYLTKKDLIFFPVKHAEEIGRIHGVDMDRYSRRMKYLFSPSRNQN
jgi:hypothetical protein